MTHWFEHWIPQVMQQWSYLGIAFLMFIENVFPIIPSEVFMPLVGFTVSQGQIAFFPAVFAGVVGTILGAYPWYYVGKWVNEERLEHIADRYGKWVGISAKDIHRANHWFDKHGGQAVFICRMIPVLRTLISIPAGINEMPLMAFTLYSIVGTVIWVGALMAAGYKLGHHYEEVANYLAPFSKVIVIILAVALLVWIGRKLIRRYGKPS